MIVVHSRKLFVILLTILMLVMQTIQVSAQSSDEVSAPDTVDATSAGDPSVCIDPLKASHIAATIISVLPIPGFSDGGDLAEYLVNLALKDCQPVLDPPPDRVFDPRTAADIDADPCTQHLYLPLADEDAELITLDRQIIEAVIDEIDNDPRIDAPLSFLKALRDQLESEYGRFESEKQGEYTNIYGIVFSSPSHGANWGDFGSPEVYHYNSDVRVQMQHGGTRVDDNYLRYRPGSYSVRWHGETLISGLDFVYIPGGLDNPVTDKAQKEAAEEVVEQTVKKAAKDAVERGSRIFAEKTAKEVIKEAAEELAEEIAEQTIEEAVFAMLDSYYSLGAPHGVYVDDTQWVVILDGNKPTISGTDPVTIEALEPGGVTSGRHIGTLREALVVKDDCDPDPDIQYSTPRFWPLGETNEIIWTAYDNGAASASGGRNSTQASQQINVVDTKPPILVAPPPVIMEGTGAVDVSLGWPQVFDVADLRPSVSNDAPAQFMPGVYRINWTAIDGSGNVSEATDDSEQIVNIKAPGTNLSATAFDQTGNNAIAAIADEPTRITVRGQDGNSPPDPLWFSIEDQPDHGYFIAPLYPYFIEDYRMAARYSPTIAAAEGEEFAWQVAMDPSAMRDYIKQLCEEEIRRLDLPKDFVSWGGGRKYFAVDDEGYTFIYDNAYRKCTPGGSTVAPYTTPRISVWDEDGHYVGELEQSNDSRPLRDININVGRGTILGVRSDGSSTGNSLVEVSTIQTQNAGEPIVEVQTYSLWNEINDIYVGEDNTRRGPEYKNAGAAAWDNINNILYVIGDPNQNIKGMVALQPAECNNSTGRGPEDCLDLLGVPVYAHSITQSTRWGDFPGIGVDAMRLQQIRDITIDSQGYVYILVKHGGFSGGFDRIYKFSPAVRNADGTTAVGEFLGWLGKCENGPNCNYIDQHSIGFACTDETCGVPNGTAGDRPGQFANAAAIAMDPNDVLYVADSGNSRVQRFNSDGLFAGEAHSTGDGDGFVLGDFGRPSNIAVNTGSFYILDSELEIVHVFDAAVIHGIDDTSAWVEYQSDSNYVGLDRFTFSATDGFRTSDNDLLSSPPATVEINVARNFRPPQAQPDLATVTPEDTPVAVTLEGSDLDGDGLSYEVTLAPFYGDLSGTPPNLIYTPDPHIAGKDDFQFVAIDDSGHADNRSQPATFAITVEPLNDTPVVTFGDDELHTGIGYPLLIRASVFDPDRDDSHTVVVDWGDGAVENQGKVQNDGTLSGPILIENTSGDSKVLAHHTYSGSGPYTVQVCVTDSSETTGCAQKLAVLEAMADIAVERDGPHVLPEGVSSTGYTLSVSNELPPRGSGFTASNVVVTETFTDGLRLAGTVENGTSCAVSGDNMRCDIGSLSPGQSLGIEVSVSIDGSPAAGTILPIETEASQNGNDPIPENNVLLTDLTIVHDADFIVDSYEDDGDSNRGDGVCNTAQNVCTLRAAVQEANALAGKQSIALANGIYLLNPPIIGNAPTVEPQPEDEAFSGDLDILDEVEIFGLSAQNTVIHGNNFDRIFHVLDSGTLLLTDVMLTGGSPLGFSSTGGGLLNSGGDATLRRVSVVGNSAIDGAGIDNASGSMLIVESSITNNQADSDGGGIHNGSTLELRNVTISGNRASTGGGLAGMEGTARLENVTLTGNIASSTGGGISAPGETVVVINSIIAANDAPLGPACSVAFRSEGHNLVDPLRDCSVAGETGSNISGESALLDVLGLNRASTFSRTPLVDSRVIDSGTCRLDLDQRGMERPFGDDCDIGAVEYGAEDVVEPPRRWLLLPLVMR